ncbi:hypothetical protein [Seleniivibrio woodruffii]|uniref:hypothetical protein n=1 Tax=Seleniivibrio woodruffii TaxID=1078050 RepID=UPI0039E6959A
MYVKEPLDVPTSVGTATIYQGASFDGYFAGGGWLVRKKFRLFPDGRLFDPAIPGVPMGGLKLPVKTPLPDMIEIQAVIGSKKLAETMDDAVSDLENVYFERCGTCHRAYEPSFYSYPEWETVVRSMRLHAGLDEKSAVKILRYLALLAPVE